MFSKCCFLLLILFSVCVRAEPSLRELLDLLNSPPEGDILLRVRREQGLDDFTKEDLWWLKMGEEGAAAPPDQTFGTLNAVTTEDPTTVPSVSSITNGTVYVTNGTVHVTNGTFHVTNGTSSITTTSINGSSSIMVNTTNGITASSSQESNSSKTNQTKPNYSKPFESSTNISGAFTFESSQGNTTSFPSTLFHQRNTSSSPSTSFSQGNTSFSVSASFPQGNASYSPSFFPHSKPMSSSPTSFSNPFFSSSFNNQSSSIASIGIDSSSETVISLSTKPSSEPQINTMTATTKWIYPNRIPEDRFLIRTVFNNVHTLTDEILRFLKDALQNAYKKAFSKHMQRHFERKDLQRLRSRRVAARKDELDAYKLNMDESLRRLPERLRRSIQETEVRIHNVTKSESSVSLIYSVYSEDWPVDAKVAVEDMSYLTEKELASILVPFSHERTEPVIGEVDSVVTKPPSSQYWVIGAVLGPLLLVLVLIGLLLYVCKRPKSVSSARKRIDPETPSKQQVYPADPSSSKPLGVSHPKSKGTPLFEKRVAKKNGASEANTESLELDLAEKNAMSLAGEAAVKTRKRRAQRMKSSDSGMTRTSADTDFSFVVASDSERYANKQTAYPTAPLRPAMITSPATPKLDQPVKYTYVEVYPEAKSITAPLRPYQPSAEVEVSIEVDGGSKQVTENYLIGGSGSSASQGEDGFQKIKKRVQELLDEALKLFGNYPSVGMGSVGSYDITSKKAENSTVRQTASSYGDAKPAWSLASPSTPDSAYGEETRPMVSERMTPVNQPSSPPLIEPHPLSVPSSPKTHKPRSNSSPTDSDTGLRAGDPAIPVIKAIRHELKKYNSQ